MPAAILPAPDAVERYLAGATLREIANGSPCSLRTLYRYMLKELGPERCKELQRDLLVSRIADADEALSMATDNISLGIALAQCKYARFDYERRAPDAYGPRQEVAQTLKVIIRDDVRPAPVLIAPEGEEAEDVAHDDGIRSDG